MHGGFGGNGMGGGDDYHAFKSTTSMRKKYGMAGRSPKEKSKSSRSGSGDDQLLGVLASLGILLLGMFIAFNAEDPLTTIVWLAISLALACFVMKGTGCM